MKISTADEKQCSVSIANSLPIKSSECIRCLSATFCVFGWEGVWNTDLTEEIIFKKEWVCKTLSSSLLSTNMTTENVQCELGLELRRQNACLARRRPLAHSQDTCVHPCNPTTWSGGRKVSGSNSFSWASTTTWNTRDTVSKTKVKEKRINSPASRFMSIPPKWKVQIKWWQDLKTLKREGSGRHHIKYHYKGSVVTSYSEGSLTPIQ